MASKTYSGALSGFGLVAEHAHLPAWRGRADFKIAAVAEPNPERRARAEQLLPGARVYASLEELLQKERGLDFVDIATPPFLHAPQALLSLERGLNVLCEKPLVLDPEDLRRLEAAAKAKGRLIYSVDNWRHAPLFQKFFSLVAQGAVGEIGHVELHTLRRKPAAAALTDWRKDAALSGGGVLMDHGWHALYLVHRLLGGAWEDISARLAMGAADRALTRGSAASASLGAASAEEEATVFLRYPRATALIRQTWLAPERFNRGAVFGDKGSLEILDSRLILRQGSGVQEFNFPEALSQGSAHPEWFNAMLDDFMAALENADRPGENFREAGFCLSTLLAAYKQARPALSAA